MFVIAFTSVPIVGVANASIADLSSQFVGYNIVNGTVVNGVYLRGAPYFSDSNCPVYFYKINGNNIYISPGKTVYVLERENDYFYIGSRSNSLDVNNSSYRCFYANMNCKLKNIINITKITILKTFLKKLAIKHYNYDSSYRYLEFVCGSTHYADETDETDIVWQLTLNSKNQVTPNTVVSFEANDDWEQY